MTSKRNSAETPCFKGCISEPEDPPAPQFTGLDGRQQSVVF